MPLRNSQSWSRVIFSHRGNSARQRSVPSRFTRCTGATTAAALFFAQLAPGLAQVAGDPQVAAGNVTFRQDGNTRTIEQLTGTAIINWKDFSINAGDLTRFLQPGVNSAVLNRVLGANPSLLNGQLQANGSVYLINPNGVMVGPQGRIDVGAFFASTLDLGDSEFLKGGDLLLRGSSKAAVENLGTINASSGDVMLIAYTTRNAGTVSAPQGTVGLAAGSEVLLTEKGDQRLLVRSGVSADKLATGVENSGVLNAARAELKAAGGLYQLAVNQSGIIRATGVENKDGRVLLTADAGDLRVSGDISAHNADGSGGTILIGGGYQGKNAAVANAANTTVTASAKLDASATATRASGGQIVVWSDLTTAFSGHIAARGGAQGGDGGSLEVSGKRVLDFTGTADTTAAHGRRGSLLLDPDAIIIGTADDQNLVQQGGFIQAGAVPSFVNAATVNTLLASTEVTIVTGDDATNPGGFNGISVNADLGWATNSRLTLISGDTIAINANINGGTTGNLTLQPGTVAPADSATGAITLASNKAITVNTLTIQKGYLGSTNGNNIGAITLSGTVNASVVDLVRNSGGVTGDITLTNSANQIGTLRGTGANAAITGALRVNDSAGGLVLDGNLSGITGAIDIATTGNLTVNTGALVKNTGASDLVLAARSGSFVNNAGASAIDATGAGRYLIYSDTPANTTKGGLTGATTYNRTYANNAPATITATGDRFLFSLAPTLTFTADNLAKTYGAANPAFTFSVTGLQSGDTLGAAISGTPTLSSTATAATGAGTAAISLANGSLALSDMGYGLSLQAGTLTINKAPLTITADNLAKTYGAANPTLTASYSGFVNGDTTTAVSNLFLSTTALTSSSAGTYTITPSLATSANYALTFATGNLTINQAPLTITANNLAKTYGAANPALTTTFTGLVNGDTPATAVSGLSVTTAATAATGVGTYAITPASATSTNYALTFTPGSLTINQAPLTITANNASRAFNTANPTFTALYTGLVNGDSSSVVSGLLLSTTAVLNSPVGNYPITASGASAANYSISFLPGSLSIANQNLTITANDASRLYGAANPTFTASYAGFVGGDTAAIVTGLQFNTSATVGSNVGTYAITPFGATAPNYGITFVPGTLTIGKAPLTITANNLARTYGAANPLFTATYTGLVNGDTGSTAVSGLSLTTTATSASNVGAYGITASGATSTNYALTFGNGTLTVNPAPLTITANNLSKATGTANPTLTASFAGFVNGDTSAVVSGLSLATTAITNSPAGAYPITASGAAATNYTFSYVPGTLTVGNSLLTITANNASRIYGSVNPTFTASFSGFNGGDTSAIVSGLQFSTTATLGSNVGSYTITPFGATAPNYTLAYVSGSLSVTPAALTIRPNDLARTYGAANPTLSASFTGFVNGDTSAVVSGLSLATTATSASSVGSYPITASGASASNYSITFNPGSLTVNKAPLTISGLNASRTYGAANPTFSVTYTGLVNGDTAAVVSGLTSATTATTASGVGNYPISLTGATATNYAITIDPGQLSIDRAPLTVTAANATRTYGDANPAFTGSITGFVNGETSSVLTTAPTFASSANLTSNVGNYSITGSGAAAANYSFTFAPGTLAITPAVLSVRADNLVRTYGDANPTLTYSVSGLKNGDSAAGKFFVSLFGTTAAANSPVGNYAIQLQGLDTPNDNYTTFFAPGTLSILARPLTIRTDNATREYGLANPAFTASFTGLASFDSPSVISNLAFTTAATLNTGVSTVGVMPSSAANRNYAISYVPGQLTITPAPLTIAAGNFFRTYGDANPTFTAAIAAGSLRAGDTATAVGLRIDTTATPASSVGTFDLTAALTSPNYTLTNSLAGSLQILPAILDVTVGNATRIYGNANPANVPITATGLKLADTAASLFTFSNSAPLTAPVGSYSLTASLASATPNYQLRSVTPGTLVVTPRPITITVDHAQRIYGNTNPAFTAQIGGSGLAPFDPLLAVLAPNIATSLADSPLVPVGSYPLVPATVANPNYIISPRSGTLTITPRPVTLTGLDLSRLYFDANPTTLYAIGGSGLAPFDQLSAILSSPGTLPATSANVGTYAFTPQLATNPNYAVTVPHAGSLAITPRPVTITVDSVDVPLGGTNPPFTASFAGLPADVTSATAFPNLTFKTGPLPVSTAPNTFALPDTFTLSGRTISRLQIVAEGFASNPNFAVTMLPAVLTTTTAIDEDTLKLEAAIAADKVPLVVRSEMALPAPFRGPAAQPYLEKAAKALMAQLTESGDTVTLAGYFKDGVAGFVAALATDSVRQTLLVGALSDVVRGYAMLPADQQPPELADLIQTSLNHARQVKLDQAKEVVRQYDEWAKPPPTGTPQVLNVSDLQFVPDFAKEVMGSFNTDAAIVIGSSLGAGATVGGLMAAIPVGMVTSAVGVGATTSLAAASGATLASSASALSYSGATLGTGTVIGTIGAPVIVAVGAAAVIATASVMLAKQPAIIAAIDEAKATSTKTRSNIAIDLTNPSDLAAFNIGFINLMLGGGVF